MIKELDILGQSMIDYCYNSSIKSFPFYKEMEMPEPTHHNINIIKFYKNLSHDQCIMLANLKQNLVRIALRNFIDMIKKTDQFLIKCDNNGDVVYLNEYIKEYDADYLIDYWIEKFGKHYGDEIKGYGIYQ
jgi:hypothetical protein